MVAPIRPTSTKVYLRKKVIFVPSGAYNIATPSLAILTAASALDVSKMFFASSASPSQSTNLAKLPKRIGDAEVYEFVGETNVSLGEMRYSFNQQAAALDDMVKAFEKFVPGTAGWLVFRYGILVDTDLAVGQFVSSHPCEVGPQMEIEEGADDGAEAGIAQTFAKTGPGALRKAVIA